MWQFPMTEKHIMDADLLKESLDERYSISVEVEKKLGEIRHIFSHIIWELDVYAAKTNTEAAEQLRFVSVDELADYPFRSEERRVGKEWRSQEERARERE